ncbi:hypothetical protein QUF58_07965 [Anaerolineales bacterium HSG24]|nr:hypothetical protein [Anaerolineales bacterium HSG24]
MTQQQWYRTYQMFGYPSQIIERVSQKINRDNLSDYIPRLCFERPDGRQRSKEFYLFIGINSPNKGHVSPEIHVQLSQLKLGHYIGDVDFAEIKTFVSSEIVVEEYSRKIRYTPPRLPQFEDVFDAHATHQPATRPTFTFQEPLNHLLYWLSAKREGSWQQFSHVYQTLGLPESNWTARQIFRYFRLLGHVEYVDDGRQWVVAPSCLVQLSFADEGYRYVLTGQRVPKLLNVLEKIATVETEPQAHHGAPDCVQLRFDSADGVKTLLENPALKKVGSLHDVGETAYKLVSILPDVNGYQARLRPVSGLVLSKYEILRWSNRNFNPVSLPKETGLYQLKSTTDSFQITLLYDAKQEQWLQGDWYGLRFLALYHADHKCETVLDVEQGRMALPVNYRWPDWYERALVLASGRLPEQVDDWLYFKNISSFVAKNLSHKLTALITME